jgi:hypothetical protein
MDKSKVHVSGAAFIAALGIYVPIVGVRGAAVGLFPGIAFRSVPLMVRGAVLGSFADIFACIVWLSLCFNWHPRGGYSAILDRYLPPEHSFLTYMGSTIPNGLQFGAGLVWWTGVMIGLWIYLWPTHFALSRQLVIIGTGCILASFVASGLWVITPLDDWSRAGARPFADLSPVPYVAVFVLSMPTCFLSVAFLFRHWTPRHESLLTHSSSSCDVKGSSERTFDS